MIFNLVAVSWQDTVLGSRLLVNSGCFIPSPKSTCVITHCSASHICFIYLKTVFHTCFHHFPHMKRVEVFPLFEFIKGKDEKNIKSTPLTDSTDLASLNTVYCLFYSTHFHTLSGQNLAHTLSTMQLQEIQACYASCS